MLIKKKNIGNVCKSLIWNKNVVLFYVFKGVFFIWIFEEDSWIFFLFLLKFILNFFNLRFSKEKNKLVKYFRYVDL